LFSFYGTENISTVVSAITKDEIVVPIINAQTHESLRYGFGRVNDLRSVLMLCQPTTRRFLPPNGRLPIVLINHVPDIDYKHIARSNQFEVFVIANDEGDTPDPREYANVLMKIANRW
jgi:hypothetical protein